MSISIDYACEFILRDYFADQPDLQQFYKDVRLAMKKCNTIVFNFEGVTLNPQQLYIGFSLYFRKFGEKVYRRVFRLKNLSERDIGIIEGQLYFLFNFVKKPLDSKKGHRFKGFQGIGGLLAKYFDTPEQACEFFGVTKFTLFHWRDGGVMPTYAMQKLHLLDKTIVNPPADHPAIFVNHESVEESLKGAILQRYAVGEPLTTSTYHTYKKGKKVNTRRTFAKRPSRKRINSDSN